MYITRPKYFSTSRYAHSVFWFRVEPGPSINEELRRIVCVDSFESPQSQSLAGFLDW